MDAGFDGADFIHAAPLAAAGEMEGGSSDGTPHHG
jgi:hypothetical protein